MTKKIYLNKKTMFFFNLKNMVLTKCFSFKKIAFNQMFYLFYPGYHSIHKH